MFFLLNIVVIFVAAQHFLFSLLEIFFWTKPLGLKIFRQPLDKAQASSALAANQGVYNGFLTAGLIWSLLHPKPEVALQLQIFFFSCVFVAGAFGGFSVNRKIFLFQGLPGAIGIAICLSLLEK